VGESRRPDKKADFLTPIEDVQAAVEESVNALVAFRGRPCIVFNSRVKG
jgi:hypothetical protein